jgi:hypothetical protein
LGIDRVHNPRAYDTGNSVPCCTACNFMKHDKTAGQFIADVMRLAIAQGWVAAPQPIAEDPSVGVVKRRYAYTFDEFKRRIEYERKMFKRKTEVHLTEEAYMALREGPCVYCGCEGPVGIDRIVNPGNYVDGNCVSACANCNFLRGQLTREVFMDTAKRIATTWAAFSLDMVHAAIKNATTEPAVHARVLPRAADSRPVLSPDMLGRVVLPEFVFLNIIKVRLFTAHRQEQCGSVRGMESAAVADVVAEIAGKKPIVVYLCKRCFKQPLPAIADSVVGDATGSS